MEQKQTIERQKQNVFVIRHAESQFNLAQFNYGGEKAATTVAHESLYIKFDPQLMDSSLTNQGIEQCQETRNQLFNTDFKIVIVSPLKRTLETCQSIFKDHPSKPIIIVDPLFRENLLSSCDIGSKILESQQQYQEYDFTLLKEYKYQKQWPLYTLMDENVKQEVFKYIEQQCNNDSKVINEQGELILLQYLKQIFPKIIDTPLNSMQRSLIQRQKIQNIAKQYNLSENDNIAVVGHRQNLYYFTADSIDIENQIVNNGIRLKNAEFQKILI